MAYAKDLPSRSAGRSCPRPRNYWTTANVGGHTAAPPRGICGARLNYRRQVSTQIKGDLLQLHIQSQRFQAWLEQNRNGTLLLGLAGNAIQCLLVQTPA